LTSIVLWLATSSFFYLGSWLLLRHISFTTYPDLCVR